MITALQAWITGTFDIFDPVALSVGVFRAGTQQNVIPGTATFEATVRVCRGIAETYSRGDAHAARCPAPVIGHGEGDDDGSP
ncbi:hypothetical protein [Streptomyces luteocolor]|uniref:hypothetical protein n=1 Tax=Streptomyces luteocolor TaxID=285500 RepID=UPI003F75DDCE